MIGFDPFDINSILYSRKAEGGEIETGARNKVAEILGGVVI